MVQGMKHELEDKVVVVTGAARGIGQALVKGFRASGSRVVALDRSWTEDDPFRRELMGDPKVLVASCDIASDAKVRDALEATLARFGRVDVLINNAAMRQRDFFPTDGACEVLKTTDEQWERMFALNVTAQLRVTRAFIEPMLRQRQGHVINISAKGGVNYVASDETWSMAPHLRFNQPYDASKAAFSSMSFYLAEEVREAGVAVNIVFPGAIRSTGVDEMEEGRRKLGIQMRLGEPEEVVPLVMHLAERRGVEVTGTAFDSVHWNRTHEPAGK